MDEPQNNFSMQMNPDILYYSSHKIPENSNWSTLIAVCSMVCLYMCSLLILKLYLINLKCQRKPKKKKKCIEGKDTKHWPG